MSLDQMTIDAEQFELAMNAMEGDDWAVIVAYVNKFNSKDIDVYVVKSKLNFQQARRIVSMIDDGDITPKSRAVMIDLIAEMDNISRDNAEKVFINTYEGRAMIVEIDK